jgi:predicted XRE-type DNA-binding protein
MLRQWNRGALVVHWRSRASQVIDLIDLQQDRIDHIMTNQLKIAFLEKVSNVFARACEEIVEADDL